MSTDQIFRQLQSDRDNSRCFDCGRSVAQWASVNHGIYVCMECSGQHRGLGTHISFVRSISMDSWTMGQLNMMKAGGNRRFADFISNYDIPPSFTIQQKYYSRAAEYYRQLIKAEAEGRKLTYPPPTLHEGLQPYIPIHVTSNALPYNSPPQYYQNYQKEEIPDSSIWGSAKNVLGNVIGKANELAYSTVETFTEQGVIGTLKNATSTAMEKSKEMIGTIADSGSFTTVKDKSWEYYSSISQTASNTYNRIRGNPIQSPPQSFTGYNRTYSSQPQADPTQSYGAYQPPSTTYTPQPVHMNRPNTISSAPQPTFQPLPSTFQPQQSFFQPNPSTQPKFSDQSFFQPRPSSNQQPLNTVSNPRPQTTQSVLLPLNTPNSSAPDLLTGD